jgi:hypothetical protein
MYPLGVAEEVVLERILRHWVLWERSTFNAQRSTFNETGQRP